MLPLLKREVSLQQACTSMFRKVTYLFPAFTSTYDIKEGEKTHSSFCNLDRREGRGEEIRKHFNIIL